MKRALLYLIPVLVLLIVVGPFVMTPVEKKEWTDVSYIDIPWMSKAIKLYGQPDYIQIYYESRGRLIFMTWVNEVAHSYFTVVARWEEDVKEWDLAGFDSGATEDPAKLKQQFLLDILEEYQKRNAPKLQDPNKPAPLTL